MSYLDELFSLRGKTAIITGGGRGIGQVVALGLSKAQADIVILSRSDASETIKLINDNGGKCCHIKCDVTDENAVNNAMKKILNNSNSIDILFNNAGICIHKSTFETSIEEFRQVIETNLIGQFIMARAVGKNNG
ncbi:SDR family NAD(P)-dependent oxidoreductase [uncultured Brachyspira sp.]|uniref:SDR family NAD(P)-dependent oxidoreductase n=1 Tax=uncultured Brachyspira sp. TaxID=221953 RepID=UPI00259BCC1D|nr:SDR family NAD(P)-dependent oxidoreductase [uncultured Brachyspira sp.]